MTYKKTAISTALILCLMYVWALAGMALAAEKIDVEREVSLTVNYVQENAESVLPLSGAKFQLYKVASINELGELSACAEFIDQQQQIADLTGKNHDDEWRTLATTLEGIIALNKISACDSGSTDQTGKLAFPNTATDLKPGLYLLIGEQHKQGGYRYEVMPTLLLLPQIDTKENIWLYSTTCKPKSNRDKTPGKHSTPIELSVLKIWQDNGHEQQRPNEVSVMLLRDGEIYSTVSLNADNNWRHSWQSLSDNYKWTLAEKAIEGYTGTVSRDGTAFIVTNTYSTPGGGDNPPDNPPGDNPPGDNPPGGGGGDDGENPPDENFSQENNSSSPLQEENLRQIVTSETTLPNTGQLWLPIPIMLFAGFLLLALGVAKDRG